MIALDEGQYELDGLVLGAGTPYVVTSFEDGGLPEKRTQDTEFPDDDGQAFGRDTFGGMLPTLDVMVETAGGGPSFDAVQAFRARWRGDAVRRTPGAVQVLRVRRPGGTTRRTYGRSNRATPVLSRNTGVGLVPVVADFRSSDDRWYDDVAVVDVLGLVPPTTGGIVSGAGGFVFPLSTALAGESRPGIVDNPGDVDTWPVVTVSGQVAPGWVIELRDVDGAVVWLLELSIGLAAGQSVTIDTRPWVRTVLRENGANVSGKRTRRSTRLGDVTIPPGQSVIAFRGSSVDGSAQAELRYEPAYAGH